MATGRKTGGRKKGTPNKDTAELREMILAALDRAGGIGYLARRAKDTPGAFMALLGKVLPMQVTGPDGGPIEHRIASAKGELEAVFDRLAKRSGPAETSQ